MAEERETQRILYASMTTVAYRSTVAGAQHMNFSDVPFLVRDNHGSDASRALRIASDYLAAFRDRHLRDRPSPLLLDGSRICPEVGWGRFPGSCRLRKARSGSVRL